MVEEFKYLVTTENK